MSTGSTLRAGRSCCSHGGHSVSLARCMNEEAPCAPNQSQPPLVTDQPHLPLTPERASPPGSHLAELTRLPVLQPQPLAGTSPTQAGLRRTAKPQGRWWQAGTGPGSGGQKRPQSPRGLLNLSSCSPPS